MCQLGLLYQYWYPLKVEKTKAMTLTQAILLLYITEVTLHSSGLYGLCYHSVFVSLSPHEEVISAIQGPFVAC